MKNPFELTPAEWVAMSPEERAQAHVAAGQLARKTIEHFIGSGACAYIMLCTTPDVTRLQATTVDGRPDVSQAIQFALAQNRVPFEFFADGHDSVAAQCFMELNQELEAAIDKKP